MLKIKNTAVIFFLFVLVGWSQDLNNNNLSYSEFLAFVKQYHPVIKQANLSINASEIKLLKARGITDPTLEFSMDDKLFDDKRYWDKLSSTFKVPTIFGVDLKVDYQNNSGLFLNPESSTPNEGLYSAGVSINLAEGLFINKRLVSIRQAKFYVNQIKEEQLLTVNSIIYEASLAYFEWLEYSLEYSIYSEYLRAAQLRLLNIEKSVQLGDKPEIEVTEARIVLKQIELNLENTKLNRTKSKLKVSSYLWYNDLPLEIVDTITPANIKNDELKSVLNLSDQFESSEVVMNHPKIRSIEFKSQSLSQEFKLSRSMLLPKFELSYNFLTGSSNQFNDVSTNQYKALISLKQPILMRKQRANLKMSKLKLQDLELERQSNLLLISNKIESVKQELNSYNTQQNLFLSLISDYERMVVAEQRRFDVGESSLFLINSRENKLFEAKLKSNRLNIKSLKTLVKLYNVSGLNI